MPQLMDCFLFQFTKKRREEELICLPFGPLAAPSINFIHSIPSINCFRMGIPLPAALLLLSAPFIHSGRRRWREKRIALLIPSTNQLFFPFFFLHSFTIFLLFFKEAKEGWFVCFSCCGRATAPSH